MRLIASTPIVVGDSTLQIVARLVIEADSLGPACLLHANKAPYALVVRDARGLRALDMSGRPLPLAELAKGLPELEWITSGDTGPTP
jgi:hypothetical protein